MAFANFTRFVNSDRQAEHRLEDFNDFCLEQITTFFEKVRGAQIDGNGCQAHEYSIPIGKEIGATTATV